MTGKALAYREVVADVFKALADATRRTILDELTERDGQTLFEICARLTTKHGLNSSRQAISQHLGRARTAAGLVETRRDGRYKFHHINTAPLEPIVDRWLQQIREGNTVRINLTSVLVDDQDRAASASTPKSSASSSSMTSRWARPRWITVVSPGTSRRHRAGAGARRAPGRQTVQGGPGRPTGFRSRPSKSTTSPQNIERLTALGVRFTQQPTEMGPVVTTVLRRHLRQPHPDPVSLLMMSISGLR